jgi:hypothetical protein
MDIFLKAYKEIQNSLFKPLGFRVCRKNCYRVVGDVFQTFELQCRGGDVIFGTIPLCCDTLLFIEKAHTPMMYSLCRISKTFPLYSFPNDETGIYKVEKLSDDLQAYVLPFFVESEDCASSYKAAKKLEAYLEPHLLDGDVCCLTAKAYMLLKAGCYERALEILKRVRDEQLQCIQANYSWQESEKDLQEWKKSFESQSDWWNQRIALVETRDPERIMPWLLGNERKSRIALGLEKPNEKG